MSALVALFALCGCDMPNHAEQVAHNEVKLSAEGILALKIGDPAPALELQGTAGSQLSIGVPVSVQAVPEPAAASAPQAAATPALPPAAPASGALTDAAAGTAAGEAETAAEPAASAQSLPPQAPHSPAGPYIALYFFPAPDTPNSSKQLMDYSRHYADLKADGLELYGVCVSPLASLESFAVKYSLLVPLLADESGEASRAYGCLPAPGRFAQRSTVLIGRDGRILLYDRGMLTADALRKAAGLGAHVEAPAAD
jgi:peroxiredoxin